MQNVVRSGTNVSLQTSGRLLQPQTLQKSPSQGAKKRVVGLAANPYDLEFVDKTKIGARYNQTRTGISTAIESGTNMPTKTITSA